MTVATEQYMYISLRVVGNKLCPQLHELMASVIYHSRFCVALSCPSGLMPTYSSCKLMEWPVGSLRKNLVSTTP